MPSRGRRRRARSPAPDRPGVSSRSMPGPRRTVFDMRFEGFELIGQEGLDLIEPAAQVSEGLTPQAVDANSGVLVGARRVSHLDEAGAPQYAEVTAHRRPAQHQRVGQGTRATRL